MRKTTYDNSMGGSLQHRLQALKMRLLSKFINLPHIKTPYPLTFMSTIQQTWTLPWTPPGYARAKRESAEAEPVLQNSHAARTVTVSSSVTYLQVTRETWLSGKKAMSMSKFHTFLHCELWEEEHMGACTSRPRCI